MLGSDKEHQANSQHQAKLDILVGYFSHVIKNLQDFNPIRARGLNQPALFSDGYFSMKKGIGWSQIS